MTKPFFATTVLPILFLAGCATTSVKAPGSSAAHDPALGGLASDESAREQCHRSRVRAFATMLEIYYAIRDQRRAGAEVTSLNDLDLSNAATLGDAQDYEYALARDGRLVIITATGRGAMAGDTIRIDTDRPYPSDDVADFCAR